MAAFSHVVGSVDELRDLYRQPSKLVQAKKVPRLDEVTQRFIAASPFCLLATANADGSCDVSPKGGPPGFVKVIDERRIALPDLNGNNLIDSLCNIVTNGHAGLLLLVPGHDETLRIDGAAAVITDPDVLGRWDDELRRPKVAVGIEVEAAFIHCAKAFRRGKVWQPESWPAEGGAPDGCDLIVSHLALEQTAQELRAGFEEGYRKSLAEDLPVG
jgi:PPOX class probable FMN-dependent enzyme